MKIHKILLLSSLFLTFSAIAQDDQQTNLNDINDKKHEFRIDVLEGLGIQVFDVSYEYVINKYSGAGASISVAIGDPDIDFPQDFAITPYFRQYFFNKEDYGAKGFFAEGLLQVATGEGRILDFSDDDSNDWTLFGVGATIGWKWVSQNGFVIDVHGGGGRYFGSDTNEPGGFARIGVSFGYRF